MAKAKRATWFKVFLSDKPICDEVSDEDLGRALRAALQYFEDESFIELNPIQRMIFAKFRVAVDEAKTDYEKSVKNGEKGGRPPKGGVTVPNPGLPILTHSDAEAEIEAEAKADAKFSLKDRRENASTPPFPPTSNPPNNRLDFESKQKCALPEQYHTARNYKQPLRKYGEYGWVKLSDDEHSRLLSEMGIAELNRCITYVDESAQKTGNKNKWKDWNLVVRKCHRERWGLPSPRRSEGSISFMEIRESIK